MNLIEHLTIERRFNGPPQSANGGWAAGLLAQRVARDTGSNSVSVALRAPPPLGEVLHVCCDEQRQQFALYAGDTLLAQAQAVEFEQPIAKIPSLDEAQAAGDKALQERALRPSWPYSLCFGCGSLRHDGLRITPGPVGWDGVVAARWSPPLFVANAAGEVSVEAVWAALDCPAGIAWSYQLPEGLPMMTANIKARIERPPRAGESYVVMGWPLQREGRKLHAASALVSPLGEVLACSQQLWLVPKQAY